MKIAICDDEGLQLALLTKYCKEWGKSLERPYRIDTFESAEAFLFHYEEEKDYDVLFLDIQMKEMSGMDLAKKLRNLGEQMMIIFITGNTEYVFEGYGVQALDYLVKPVKEERLFQVLNRCLACQKKTDEYLLVECDGMIHKIKQSDICSIESIGHDTILHMIDQDFICKKGIGVLEKEVNEKIFYRCHRSYLVNLSKINRIAKKEVAVDGERSIPIARGKWEGLHKAYLNFYRGVICP